MPCGRCQHWIRGEWIKWMPCFATPFEGDWLRVHTSFVPHLDRPLVINFVLGEAGTYWYFFCERCRRALRAHKFQMRLMTQISEYTDFPLFQSSHSPTGRINWTETASQDSSETNPWEGHLEWSNTVQQPRLCQVLPIDIKCYFRDSLKVRKKATILCVLLRFTLRVYVFLCSFGLASFGDNLSNSFVGYKHSLHVVCSSVFSRCIWLYMSCDSHLWIHLYTF